MAITSVQERRQVQRIAFQGRVELEAPSLQARVQANSLNLSERGVCVRLQEAVEVRSPVSLRLFDQTQHKPLECAGRVAWVVQRLDLRGAPPFLYDVGVEFVDPPARLRQFVAGIGVAAQPTRTHVPLRTVAKKRATSRIALEPITLRERCYMPCLEQEPLSGGRWHLIVTVEGIPCFSRRYASSREAIEAWKQFKRQTSLSRPRRGKSSTGKAQR